MVLAAAALPSWDDYLQTALDDLVEAGSQSPMVLLRTRALLAGLLNAAPPQRRSSITWRLHRAEELAAGSFPAIWRHATGGDPGMSRPRPRYSWPARRRAAGWAARDHAGHPARRAVLRHRVDGVTR